MNDFQVYLIAQQRMDQLHAEAMALDHGPGVPRRLADSLRALADWMRIPGLLRRLTPISARPDTPCTASSTPARTSRWQETCFVPVRSAKEPDMPSVHRTRVRYRGSAAIAAAAVFAVFAVAGSAPAWAQPDFASQGGLLTRDGKGELLAGAAPLETRIAKVLRDGEISDPADAGNWIIIV
jgi:hypothetical protein